MSKMLMSASNDGIPSVPPGEAFRWAGQQTIETVRPAMRFAGFWLAVVLPLVYLPLLLNGLEGDKFHMFFGLFVVNILALLAGHNYARYH